MDTSMHSSVSSTLVTVWAFKRNCFLIKVSMSTSVRIPSCSLIGTTNLNRCRGALQISIRPQAQVFQGLQLPLHFSERNHFFSSRMPLSSVISHLSKTANAETNWSQGRPIHRARLSHLKEKRLI